MEQEASEAKINAVADWIYEAGSVVVFTGAGVSTESGIPDFRSPGGIWSKFDPEDFTIDRFLNSPETRRKQWKILLEGGLFVEAEPNMAHLAVAELEKLGKLTCVITQNVDNLHQKAGNLPENVYELHGNMNWLICLECGLRYPLREVIDRNRANPLVPACEHCQGILKPDVIFFGESLPEQTLNSAAHYASHCDLLIVIGSSLVVYPAAYMPMYAKGGGARLVIINMSETPYDDHADACINMPAGEAMDMIVKRLKSKLAKDGV